MLSTNMKFSPMKVVICGVALLSLVSFSSLYGVAQDCKTCGGDFSTCNGSPQSGIVYCGGGCNCGLVQPTYLDTLQPGFFTTQKNGKLVVSSLIPGSPAETAGIQRNDIILKINQGFGASRSAQRWSYDSGHFSRIVVSRNGHIKVFVVGLKSVRQFLSENRRVIAHLQDVSFDHAGEDLWKSPSVAFHSLGR